MAYLKILYIGGVKSGKSRLAEQRALVLATPMPPVYLATTNPQDQSMADRIAQHRQQRGDRFLTIEEPWDLVSAVAALPEGRVVLVDCLTLWLSNMLLDDRPESDLYDTIDRLLALPHTLIFVINDVGSGIHAPTALGRRFTDLSGLVAQRVAAGCQEVYHCIAGIDQRIR